MTQISRITNYSISIHCPAITSLRKVFLRWVVCVARVYINKSSCFMCVYVCVFAVACSTVTVTKCQAALRTLQAFPFFRPTCLCREPHVDPECNSFRDFLFDHPCIYVNKKGELVSEETRRDDGESAESDACRTLAPATGATLSSDKLHNMPPFVYFESRHTICSQSQPGN